ncbi:hypothetical protein ACFWP5_02505 [Streptomyces sp. NPDC058469]
MALSASQTRALAQGGELGPDGAYFAPFLVGDVPADDRRGAG